MTATQTVAQDSKFRKSSDNSTPPESASISVLQPRRGVVVLYGYGTSMRVERGHLVIEDGIGCDRFRGRFSRIGHGLERVVVVGADGAVSLAALRWLADQNASFVMLERDGNVLATTGPVRPSDVRLRRAQALAHQTGMAFRISRELIDRKLAGQARVAREALRDETTSDLITQFRSELAEVESIDAIRFVESRAAKVYWRAWQAVPIKFPDRDLPRVPDHWRRFDTRASALTGCPRLAVSPINAILNYLYALLEAECRLAVAVLGLDPEMGVLHMDTPNRDSLACDLMEPIRPDVDAYVLNWIARQPLKRNWFFEERNGNCRLMAELVSQLAETSSTWARLIAPLAEWVTGEIASSTKTRRLVPATRLTQNHKRALSGGAFLPKAETPVKPQNMCGVCGHEIRSGITQCQFCAVELSTQRLVEIAREGRAKSHTDAAEAKRSKKRRANHVALQEWSTSEQSESLTAEIYGTKIQPRLAALSSTVIARHLVVSRGYAAEIKRGRMPHPRHWKVLVKLLEPLK